jgi:hypothetical protein
VVARIPVHWLRAGTGVFPVARGGRGRSRTFLSTSIQRCDWSTASPCQHVLRRRSSRQSLTIRSSVLSTLSSPSMIKYAHMISR